MSKVIRTISDEQVERYRVARDQLVPILGRQPEGQEVAAAGD